MNVSNDREDDNEYKNEKENSIRTCQNEQIALVSHNLHVSSVQNPLSENIMTDKKNTSEEIHEEYNLGEMTLEWKLLLQRCIRLHHWQGAVAETTVL